jgi:hypothetical protein
VAVLFNNQVSMYNSRGNIVWTWNGSNVIRLFAFGKSLYAIASTQGKLVITSLSNEKGTVRDTRNVPYAGALYKSTVNLLPSG